MVNVIAFNVVIEANDTDDILLNEKVSEVETAIENVVGVDYVSCYPIRISGKNYGRCAYCGAWVTDGSNGKYVHQFGPGKIENGVWVCDLCTSDEEFKF